jgi:lipoate synthase
MRNDDERSSLDSEELVSHVTREALDARELRNVITLLQVGRFDLNAAGAKELLLTIAKLQRMLGQAEVEEAKADGGAAS